MSIEDSIDIELEFNKIYKDSSEAAYRFQECLIMIHYLKLFQI